MNKDKEQEWREGARQAWRDQCSQDNEGGVDSVGFIAGYLTACKAREAEIDRFKKEVGDLIKDGKKELSEKDKIIAELSKEATRLYEPTRKFWNDSLEDKLKDRDQRIAELERLVTGFVDWFNDTGTKREPKVLLGKATAMLRDGNVGEIKMNTKTNDYADWTHVDFMFEIKRLNDEGYKMSAELEWYKRFVDHIRRNVMNEEDYREACRFIFSENDR